MGLAATLSVSIEWVSSTLNKLWEGLWWGVGLIAGKFVLEVGTWIRLLQLVSNMLSESESESEFTGSQ